MAGLDRTTTWKRDVTAPLRAFMRTESGSAGVLVTAIVAALAWANVDARSYEALWHTERGGHGIALNAALHANA